MTSMAFFHHARPEFLWAFRALRAPARHFITFSVYPWAGGSDGFYGLLDGWSAVLVVHSFISLGSTVIFPVTTNRFARPVDSSIT
jgi:hypothetical protein